jgi:hypothetical protein
MTDLAHRTGKVQAVTEMVVYQVRAATLQLPGTGMTQAWAVVRIWLARGDSPAVAVFLNKVHAEQYAEHCTRLQIEVI